LRGGDQEFTMAASARGKRS